MDPKLGTESCRSLHKSRVNFIIANYKRPILCDHLPKIRTPCQGTTHHVDGWSSTSRTHFSPIPTMWTEWDGARQCCSPTGCLRTTVRSKEKNKSRRTEKEGTISVEQPTSHITAFRPPSDSGAESPPSVCQAVDATVLCPYSACR
ncbi:hypothetical protein CORC01_01206 [Colletotrichum orchidophilum]|uniref:Uncharacterized protein n=1 Tax=Colletotrichum orchidophilum TaxID=1209926 RepID=A0A1G4BQD6_9PEZI|nr:uncharacterized protein CORC01_01206 [Colletotrichum orchidophilum]OHF03487.1 hypothetical protein CORC01_01206 [Colletotrichum orchidophilum]